MIRYTVCLYVLQVSKFSWRGCSARGFTEQGTSPPPAHAKRSLIKLATNTTDLLDNACVRITHQKLINNNKKHRFTFHISTTWGKQEICAVIPTPLHRGSLFRKCQSQTEAALGLHSPAKKKG